MTSAQIMVKRYQEGKQRDTKSRDAAFGSKANVTTTRAKIETSIPRKCGPAIAGYEKALNKFFENVLQAVLRHCDFSIVRCLVIASPGFTKDPTRACYGPKHVEVANEQLAIQTLLIADELFRNADILTRRKYAKLIESVKNAGGTAHIFSSMHVSGEQIAQLSGIAAVLRFPMPRTRRFGDAREF